MLTGDDDNEIPDNPCLPSIRLSRKADRRKFKFGRQILDDIFGKSTIRILRR